MYTHFSGLRRQNLGHCFARALHAPFQPFPKFGAHRFECRVGNEVVALVRVRLQIVEKVLVIAVRVAAALMVGLFESTHGVLPAGCSDGPPRLAFADLDEDLFRPVLRLPFDQFLRERVLAPLGMVDTDFHVHEGKQDRFAACYIPHRKGGLLQIDDPAKSRYLRPANVISGGGGLVGTAGDYLRFCRLMLNKGQLDGVRLLGRKTVELMTSNHLGGDMAAMGMPRFSESNYHGIGFGLGFSVTLDPAKAQILGTPGEYAWGGAASTAFWIDPAEDMAVLLLTQLVPSSTYPIRRELRVLTYQAVVD